MRAVGRCRVVLVLAAVLALRCDTDDPEIVPPVIVTPPEVPQRPGIFQLTSHREPDLYPVWLDTATIGYRSRNLPPYRDGLLLLARPIHGGPTVEHSRGLVDQGARFSLAPVGDRAAGSARFLVFWLTVESGATVCSVPCPVTAMEAVTVFRTDGAPIDSLPLLPLWDFPNGRISDVLTQTVRLVGLRVAPADADALSRWRDPFGPAFAASSPAFYVSDGERILRASIDPTDPTVDTVTTGSYPALSPDGATLAFVRHVVSDSTTQSCTVPALVPCVQTTVTYTVGQAEAWIRDLASGAERFLILGEQATFDPAASRVVVVTPAGLTWVDLATGVETPITNTAQAHSPAVSPDGHYLAFVAEWSGQPDVYFLAIR